MAGSCHDATGLARDDQKLPTHRAGRGLPQRIPPLPQRAMGETTLNKKMRAFDDEVALTIAPFYLVRMLQRTLPSGFIAPCLPTKTDKLPSGRLHEIKHDGFRIIARKDGQRVKLDKQLQYTWLRAVQGRHADFWQVTSDALDFALQTLAIEQPGLR